MSEDRTALSAAIDLEDDLAQARGIALCIACLGTGPSNIPPDVLAALGRALTSTLNGLHHDWNVLVARLGGSR